MSLNNLITGEMSYYYLVSTDRMIKKKKSEISGFCRDVVCICSSGMLRTVGWWFFGTALTLFSRVKQSKSWTVWPLKTGPIGCPASSLYRHESCLKPERSEDLGSQSLNIGESAEWCFFFILCCHSSSSDSASPVVVLAPSYWLSFAVTSSSDSASPVVVLAPIYWSGSHLSPFEYKI